MFRNMMIISRIRLSARLRRYLVPVLGAEHRVEVVVLAGAAGGDRAPLLRRRRDPAVAHHVLRGTGWLSGGGERKGEDGRPILSGGAKCG